MTEQVFKIDQAKEIETRANIIKNQSYILNTGFYGTPEMKEKNKEPLFFSKENKSLNGIELHANQAYNGKSGNAFNGTNSLLLDVEKHNKGYKENIWLDVYKLDNIMFQKDTAKDSKSLIEKGLANDAAKKKNIAQAKTGLLADPLPYPDIPTIDTVNITYMRTSVKVPRLKKDENGNPIPYIDKNTGKQMEIDGVKKFQYETEPVMIENEKGDLVPKTFVGKDGKTYTETKIVTDDVKLDKPQLVTTRLANLESLPNINRKMIKKLDINSVRNFVRGNIETLDTSKSIVLDELTLNDTQKVALTNYMDCKAKAQDYNYNRAVKGLEQSEYAKTAEKIQAQKAEVEVAKVNPPKEAEAVAKKSNKKEKARGR